MTAKPNTVGELLERPVAPRLNRQDIDSVRHGLHALADDFSAYSDAELLTLKNITDVTSHIIRAELRQRDAALIDILCK